MALTCIVLYDESPFCMMMDDSSFVVHRFIMPVCFIETGLMAPQGPERRVVTGKLTSSGNGILLFHYTNWHNTPGRLESGLV